MIKRKVYLKDFDYKTILLMAINENNKHDNYRLDHIKEAITTNLKANLNYSTKTGKTYQSGDLRAEYSYKKDIPEYDNIEDILEWELLSWIMNSASRLSRGYTAI